MPSSYISNYICIRLQTGKFQYFSYFQGSKGLSVIGYGVISTFAPLPIFSVVLFLFLYNSKSWPVISFSRINVMTININEKFVYEFLQLDTSL